MTTLKDATDFVLERHPGARVRYHSDADLFAVWTEAQGGERLSELFAWQSQCWFNAAERIEMKEWQVAQEGRKVIGACGEGI